MVWVHGHAQCARSGCPMYGVNQAECCTGETAETGPLTAEVAAVNPPPVGDAGRSPSAPREPKKDESG